jgi:hypothetical protein
MALCRALLCPFEDRYEDSGQFIAFLTQSRYGQCGSCQAEVRPPFCLKISFYPVNPVKKAFFSIRFKSHLCAHLLVAPKPGEGGCNQWSISGANFRASAFAKATARQVRPTVVN